MANVFKPKRSSTASSVPTTSDLSDGEIAVNSADKKIYLRDGASIIEVANSIWSTDGTDAYRTTGSVGIGSDNPTAKLDVKQTNSDTVIGKLKGSAFTAYLNIEDSTTTSGNVAVGAAGNDLLLRAGNSNHVRLNFAGNLGIGTFNPTAKLDVRGNSFFSGNITVDGTVDGRDVATDGTKLDGIEASADVTDATNVDAAGAVMNSDTSTASMSFVVDEDNMVSDSATKVPTQQSVKAYVDANAGGGGGISNYAKYVGTGTPNLNSSTTYGEVSWINTTPQFSNGTWSATSSHIVVPATGLYMVQVNFYITASVVRSNVGLKFAVNDVQQSEIAAHNYIRNNSGHNESSINMSTTLSLSANDQVSIYTAQLANGGTVSLQGTSSTIAITQLA